MFDGLLGSRSCFHSHPHTENKGYYRLRGDWNAPWKGATDVRSVLEFEGIALVVRDTT